MIIEKAYSVISNACTGGLVYELFYPEKHPSFIEYNNPFIGTLFPDDSEFVKFCEGYSNYISQEAIFVERESVKHPIIQLGDIEVHYPNDTNKNLILNKFHGRLAAGKDCKRIFIWASLAMLNSRDEDRKRLITRFLNIPDYSIFLTDREEEAVDGEHLSFHVKKWDRWTSDKAEPGWFVKSLTRQYELAEVFKELIIQKFMKV